MVATCTFRHANRHTGMFCKEKDKALASSLEILPNASPIYFSCAVFSLLPVCQHLCLSSEAASNGTVHLLVNSFLKQGSHVLLVRATTKEHSMHCRCVCLCVCVCVTKSSTICVPWYAGPFHVYSFICIHFFFAFIFKRGNPPPKHKFTIGTLSKSTVPQC